ncbi:MAG TPA: ATP-binding protein [Leptospiraceae bacterium]|nr:ATP-binding protein [Leptospiraceae bacterium]HMX32854.1 ATP-binding protein [Leptospiraceae bacterium]HMY31053.1 ATP-binding protein [Leptospiraceae bacterium]HMZ66332.1 ATP-binding protein [Leptospiraceae bacterium]HNA05856.1 ATP-binding protein [Leptospiraceae bacterium]
MILPDIEFQKIFESVPALYLIVSPDLIIVAVSDSYNKATMTKREEIIGREIFEVFPDNPNDLKADGVSNLRASLDFVIRNKVPHTMAIQKYDIRNPEGEFEVRYWSPLNTPVLNSDKEILYIIHRVEDVTEFIRMKDEKVKSDATIDELRLDLKEMEIELIQRSREIQKLNVELEQKVIDRTKNLEKANEKIQKNLHSLSFQKRQLEDFCNIISHNLRSPLVNISMLIEFITESKVESEKKLLIEKLRIASNNLNEVFDQLVESLQIQEDTEIQSENLIIQDYLQKVLGGLQGQINKSQAVFQIDFNNAATVYYPPKYLTSILHNLISNSLKYHSPDRGLIIRIQTESVANSIILSVSDNGLGIDLNKHKDNLFKIRKTFHSNPDAKGFGLFITKTQVEAMSGRIWAESMPNQGSVFYVEFKNQTK